LSGFCPLRRCGRMALLQSRCSFDLIGDLSNVDRSLTAASSPAAPDSSLARPPPRLSTNRVANATMRNLEDSAIPQVIVLIEQHWGFDDDDVNKNDDDAYEEAADSSKMLVVVEQQQHQHQQSPRPSEATIQVLKMFFDGIEDQMDVEDELLFGRPDETSSVVSDLSVVTTSTTDSSSSSSGG
jgi:hypothetical protein